MAKDKLENEPRRRVQSIEVGFRVLHALRLAEGPLPLREIAARAAMPPSKAHLYLVSFVREGMAYQDPNTGFYGLGSFAIQLGLAAIRQLDVVELAAAGMAELRDRTDCAVYLSVWGDRGPCIVSKADGNRQGAFSIRLGYILPLRTTATGLVFLAHLPAAQTERALGAHAVFDSAGKGAVTEDDEDLAAAVEETRERGYGSTVGKLNRNFAALAAPVFDYSHQLAAALTILAPVDFLTGKRQTQVADLLLEITAGISQRLGAAAQAASAAQSDSKPKARARRVAAR